MILQGKGGVGKSLISSLLAQYLDAKGTPARCIDTDPINATLSGFKGLNVQKLEIMKDDEIKTRNFDALIEIIRESKTPVIIDNGASSFIPLAHYLITNEISALLKKIGYELIIHTVIVGGQAFTDTCSGFAELITQFPTDTRFVVWLNPYWGPVEHAGRGFEQIKVYEENKSRLIGIIKLPTLKEETFGQDMANVLNARNTLQEALDSGTLPIVTLQRLQIIQRDIFQALDIAGVA